MAKSDGKVVISTELDNSNVPKGVSELKGQLGGLKSVVGKLGATIAAAFSVAAIVRFASESVQAANQLSDALTGLQSILNGQGRSFSGAQKFLEEYTADGLIPMTNAITACSATQWTTMHAASAAVPATGSAASVRFSSTIRESFPLMPKNAADAVCVRHPVRSMRLCRCSDFSHYQKCY